MLNFKFPKFLGSGEQKKALSGPRPKAWGAKRIFGLFILAIFISSIFGFLAGIISGGYFYSDLKDYLQKLNIELSEPKVTEKEKINEYIPQTSQEKAIVQVVEDISPAVVSIIVTKDLPIIEEYYIEEWPFLVPQYRQKIEKREIGGGTGFIISADGLILTNKHVVLDTEADYTVLTNDGRKFPAKVLAKDPVQDLAIIEVEGEKFQTVELGDSSNLQIGQTVIAIGNALGEFQNTVSVGVISGLGRTITASGGGIIETLEDVIQTDAAINRGNSGGPLLNLKGEVIGINTAMSIEGENIGFAIPVNKAKRAIEQVKTLGKIVYPFLGIRYILITDKIQRENNLPVNYGALILRGDKGEPAITLGSAAEKAGLQENDIVLEFNNEKITSENSLAKIIMKYNPGDKVFLKVLRDGEEKIFEVTLGERSE
ncbi:trypsin-like peptidase domain-containing protein [Patescibacteria group bacterium]|nr:trypsin-like peptidase domain-containing protein [Patescibacteria group bacterium]